MWALTDDEVYTDEEQEQNNTTKAERSTSANTIMGSRNNRNRGKNGQNWSKLGASETTAQTSGANEDGYGKPFYWNQIQPNSASQSSSSQIKKKVYNLTDGNKRNPTKIVCYYCKKVGHMERDCRKKKRDDKLDAPGAYVPSKSITSSIAPDLKHVLESQPQSIEQKSRDYIKVPLPVSIDKDLQLEPIFVKRANTSVPFGNISAENLRTSNLLLKSMQMQQVKENEKRDKKTLNLIDGEEDDPHFVRGKDGKLVYRPMSSSDEDFSSSDESESNKELVKTNGGIGILTASNVLSDEIKPAAYDLKLTDAPMEIEIAEKKLEDNIESDKPKSPEPQKKISSREDLLKSLTEAAKSGKFDKPKPATPSQLPSSFDKLETTEKFSAPDPSKVPLPNFTTTKFEAPKFDLDEFMEDLTGLTIEKAPEPVELEAKLVHNYGEEAGNSMDFEQFRHNSKTNFIPVAPEPVELEAKLVHNYGEEAGNSMDFEQFRHNSKTNFIPVNKLGKFAKPKEVQFMDWDEDDYNELGNSVDFERNERKSPAYEEDEEVWTDDSSDEAPVLDGDEEVLPKHDPFSEKQAKEEKSEEENEWQKMSKNLIQKEIRRSERKSKLGLDKNDKATLSEATDTETLIGSDSDTDMEDTSAFDLSPAKTQPSDSDESPVKKPSPFKK
uniref:CCHC-type domain-containing protein n=1 Tax=Acrobeloides nanus TaxID=290746 RepID=A0A914DT01_9BILA